MTIIILIFGALLRFISVNQSLWLDEATSALTTKMSLADFFGKFMPGDFHPPLYYLTLRVWSTFFGTSEIGLRSLSILFGVGAIYLTYLIGRELLNKKAGYVASLLLATSGLHIYYSQEARMYSMTTFLITLLIFSFVKIIKEDRNKKWWLVFSITLGAVGLADYLPLFILPVFWIYGVITKQKTKWWKMFAMSHIVLFVLALLWSPVFIKQLSSGISVTNSSPAWVSVLGTFSVKDILLIHVKFIIGRVTIENKKIYAILVGGISVLFGFLIFRSKRYLNDLKLIYLWLLVPLVLALLVSVKLPVLNYFRFLFLLPAFYLIIAFGVVSFKKAWLGAILMFILLINIITSGMYLTNMKYQREDWRSAVSYIEHNKSINSIVIFPANSQMEAYRYYSHDNIYGPDAIKSDYSEIWLVRYAQPISDPGDITKLRIEGLGYGKVGEFDFNGVVVWKYTKVAVTN